MTDTDNLSAGDGGRKAGHKFPFYSHGIPHVDICFTYLLYGERIRGSADHRHREITVALERRKPDPLHCRIRILKTIAKRTGVGIDNDVIAWYPDLLEKNIKLLCKVDIDGGLGNDRVVVRQGCSGDTAVPSRFCGPEKQAFTLTSLATFLE